MRKLIILLLINALSGVVTGQVLINLQLPPAGLTVKNQLCPEIIDQLFRRQLREGGKRAQAPRHDGFLASLWQHQFWWLYSVVHA